MRTVAIRWLALGAAGLLVVLALISFHDDGDQLGAEHPAPALPPRLSLAKASGRTTLAASVPLLDAIADGLVSARFIGNGHDRMAIAITNRSATSVRMGIAAGQIFQGRSGQVVVPRTVSFEVGQGQAFSDQIRTAALSASNIIGENEFEITALRDPRLDRLAAHLEDHPEIPPGSVQTAILALTENLPLRAFARFSTAGSDLPAKVDTAAYRADTADIIHALIVLRDLGVREDRLALTVDPQLKIEAMIDPLAHAMAMGYYRIPDDGEWEFWKNQLLNGDANTRHYALFGIARFYPDIALEMLPKWARESKTSIVFRTSAIQALAETQRPEALSVLQQLAYEFGRHNDLGKTAHLANRYLDNQINRNGAPKRVFRASQPDVRPIPDPEPSIPIEGTPELASAKSG